ncbi:hypothetical protein LRP50_05280 [Enterovibrio sp. ZSDZ42]|uniref:Uncharacterized protein n=1 Tax=Enterovibrio gelatinilyticus TaxID=2899819 RepID=A0ABT5QXR0_9GAMM|nr:hypothetical protein [Enterovibrio sp. ZSDZ42]MDD1792539.1 hypothetical protein [Enterovibrio sp. ZSDZ42]
MTTQKLTKAEKNRLAVMELELVEMDENGNIVSVIPLSEFTFKSMQTYKNQKVK